MSEILAASAFSDLFLDRTPLLDVRAPTEFRRGAFPAAINIPLLDDSQRRAVGIRFREAGQEAAIELGHQLVGGPEKEARLQRWLDFARANPGALLYCFRGGLRSRIVQTWLAELGVHLPRVAGGYKALRRHLLEVLIEAAETQPLMVIAGKTGTAKTHLLQQLPAHVDLEGLANHRGSAFGPRVGGQPVQINFENAIAIELLRGMRQQPRHLFLEDESHAIGSLSVPSALFDAMRQAPLAVVEEDLETRAHTILEDYITANLREFKLAYGATAEEHFRHYLTQSLTKIRRRLGPERYSELSHLMESALQRQQRDEDLTGHLQWITRLLEDYYDPMYDYQLSKKLSRIVFRGTGREFLTWVDFLTNATWH